MYWFHSLSREINSTVGTGVVDRGGVCVSVREDGGDINGISGGDVVLDNRIAWQEESMLAKRKIIM